MEILLASQNKNKALEFERILGPLGISVISVNDVLNSFEVDENGRTFAENAKIKAVELKRRCPDRVVIADDSGLCVDYLNGAPGVLSARYSGGNDAENNDLLLKNLAGVPMEKRTAYFVAAICLIFEDGEVLELEGRCDGRIATAPSGGNGFGYDPIFLVGDRTMAELSNAEKDEISHRGKVLKALYEELSKR